MSPPIDPTRIAWLQAAPAGGPPGIRDGGRSVDAGGRWAALRRWRPSVLQGALLASAAVHAALLGWHTVDPRGFERAFQHPALAVILVNARSPQAPAQAKAIAQADLDGGGEAREGRATSPLVASPVSQVGDAPADAHRRVDSLQVQQQQMLAMIRREIALLPPPDPQRLAGDPRQADQEEHRRQLLDRLAEIEKRINEHSEQPRRRYVGPATREAAYAVYYDALRRRIEERGTRDFPVHQGRKLYGELTMNLTIDALGQVLEAEVLRSSGQRLLDQRALAIVRAAAPFGPFTAAMLRDADQIVVTSRFRFTRDDGLETTLSTGAEAVAPPATAGRQSTPAPAPRP